MAGSEQQTTIPLTEPLLPTDSTNGYKSKLKATTVQLWRALISYRRCITVAMGPLAAMIIALSVDIQYSDNGKAPTYMLAVMAWVFIWWVTEAIPLAVTAMTPLFLLPFLEIETAAVVSKSYMNDTIFLLLGSFVLANALQAYNLHKRMALKMLMWLGGNKIDPWFLVFGFCVGPAFVSMWIHNTAAAVVMMPVAIGVLEKSIEVSRRGSSHNSSLHNLYHQQLVLHHNSQQSSSKDLDLKQTEFDSKDLEQQDPPLVPSSPLPPSKPPSPQLPPPTMSIPINDDPFIESTLYLEQLVSNFSKALVLSVSYSATIGGMSTLTGTGVNLVLVGLYESAFPSNTPIGYLQWSLFAFPLALIMLVFLWLVLCFYFCPRSTVKSLTSTLHVSHVEDELLTMGPLSYDERMVLIVFTILIVLWLTKSITSNFGWAYLFNDYPGNGSITIFMITTLFIIPSKRYAGEKLMTWSKCKDLPWGLVLLFGGGYALADGMSASGLSNVISDNLDFLQLTPYVLITPLIAILTSIVTEFTSNLSTATIFVSLLAQVATSIGRHPLFLMVPATIGSQFSFMLPIATPPNAIGYSTGHLQTKDLLMIGFMLKFFGIICLSLLMPTLGAFAFQTNS